MKGKIILGVCLALIASCSSKKQEQAQVSTIDVQLQAAVDSILQQGIENLCATSGQAIVMDVQTGTVKALSGSDSIRQESGLVRLATLLATIESQSVKLSDTVDVGDGILAIGGDTLRDHNWRTGGYGSLTVKRAFAFASNIAGYKIANKAFKNGREFAEVLEKYGYHVTDTSLVYNPSGHGVITTPLQNLQFVNAIAQGSIADKASTDSVKAALEYCVTDGLGRLAASDKVRVAGVMATTSLGDNLYAAEFCGFFPVDKPRYSIIVCINKRGFPVSGGKMGGEMFRQIADYIIMMPEMSRQPEQ